MSQRFSVSLSVGLLALVLFVAPANAQTSPDVTQVLERMQVISTQMEALQKEFASLASQLSGVQSGSVLGVSTDPSITGGDPVFTQDLTYGSTNGDIEKIQRLLATDPEIYPYGVASGFFGPKTEEALKNLQSRFGYDPVGVVGPATTALLEGYMRAYPDENYPEGLLSTRPSTFSGSNSSGGSADLLTRLQSQLSSLTSAKQSQNDDSDDSKNNSVKKGILKDNPAKTIEVAYSGNTAKVKIEYNDRDKYDDEKFTLKADSESGVVKELMFLTFLSEAEILDVITEVDGDSRGGDKNDAKDAIGEADNTIDDIDDEINKADDDGEDIDYSEKLLDEAKDLLDEADGAFDDKKYDNAIDLANDAIKKAKEAEDVIGEKERDAGDIDSIIVEVNGSNDAEVKVEYDDGDDEKFDLNEDDRDDLIEEIADELDISEGDVEDLVEFDYGDLDSITADINDGVAEVDVEFESGVKESFELDEDNEDKVISEISDLYDLRKRDVEDVIDFD